MAAIDSAISQYRDTLNSIGESGLSALFPRDFEIYLCGIELTDFTGATIDFFIFPVMPDSIQKTEAERTSITKTSNGIVVNQSNSFIPKDLTIQGNFGRSFKLLLRKGVELQKTSNFFKGLSIVQGVLSANDFENTKLKRVFRDFSPEVKTGFGCIKIIQSIIDKSKGSVNGKPVRLIFYNLSLNETYLVVPQKNPLMLSQNINDSNMIWNYTLNLKIIADMKDIIMQEDQMSNKLMTVMATNTIQKVVRDTVNVIKNRYAS